MPDVKWIKIYTNMLNNKKIKRIRKMPEGNNIILIWVFLLTAAGESNKSGGLFLTDTLPFKEDDLAIEFDFEVAVIRFALITLAKFEMIEIYDAVIYIKNWDEYQNIEGLDKIREQTRLRVARCREMKLLQSNATCNVTVTQCNAIELEQEQELDKEKELNTTSQKLKFTDEQLSIAELLLSLIKDNNPNFVMRGNINTWADEIRLMVERDKINIELIQDIVIFCQCDPFWRTNILSTKTLRKQFNQLTAKMQQASQPVQRKKTKAEQGMEDFERKMIEFDRLNGEQASQNVRGQLS